MIRAMAVRNRISAIESLVADSADRLFNARNSLKHASQEKRDILQPEKRTDRETPVKAASTYYDVFGDCSKIDQAPRGTPRARPEGGMYTNPDNDPSGSGWNTAGCAMFTRSRRA